MGESIVSYHLAGICEVDDPTRRFGMLDSRQGISGASLRAI